MPLLGGATAATAACGYFALTALGAGLLPRLSIGAPRLVLALLLLPLCAALPLLTDLATLRGTLAFLTTWLSAFKLLSAAAGRGPLALPGTTLPQRAALLLLPFHVRKGDLPAPKADAAREFVQTGSGNGSLGQPSRHKLQEQQRNHGLMVLRTAAHAVLLAYVLRLLALGGAPPWARHLLYGGCHSSDE